MDNSDRIDRLLAILGQLQSEDQRKQAAARNELARLLLPLAQSMAVYQLKRYPDSSLHADDIASTACWAAVKDIHALREPKNLLAWLRKIVQWHLINHLRKLPPELVTEELPEMPYEAPHLDHDQREAASAIRRAVSELPEKLREAVVLYYWEGHSVTECASQFGVNQPAVSHRLKRAREKIRRSLDSQDTQKGDR